MRLEQHQSYSVFTENWLNSYFVLELFRGIIRSLEITYDETFLQKWLAALTGKLLSKNSSIVDV